MNAPTCKQRLARLLFPRKPFHRQSPAFAVSTVSLTVLTPTISIADRLRLLWSGRCEILVCIASENEPEGRSQTDSVFDPLPPRLLASK